MVKNLPPNSGDTKDPVSTPGSGRSSRGRNSNPLQYSCLKNPVDEGAFRAAVHRVAKDSDMTEHARAHTHSLSLSFSLSLLSFTNVNISRGQGF